VAGTLFWLLQITKQLAEAQAALADQEKQQQLEQLVSLAPCTLCGPSVSSASAQLTHVLPWLP
jgi:hypothetical protein